MIVERGKKKVDSKKILVKKTEKERGIQIGGVGAEKRGGRKKNSKKKYLKKREQIRREVLKELEEERKKREERRIVKNRKAVGGIKKNKSIFLKKKKKRIQLSGHEIVEVKRLILTYCLLFVLLYLLVVVFVLRVASDSKIAYFVSSLVRVPAFVSIDGVVYYDDYFEIRRSILSKKKSEVSNDLIRMEVIREFKLKLLCRKYGVNYDFGFEDDKGFLNILSRKVVFDKDVNRVAFGRMMNIINRIDNGGDFSMVGRKYGDKNGEVDIDMYEKSDFTESRELMSLEDGENSGILYSDEGYYLFRKEKEGKGRMWLSYIFVEALNLDDYLKEVMSGYKVISFVK